SVEGASPKQREILHEILAGMGSTRIERLVVARYDPQYADEDEEVVRHPGPHGDQVSADFPPGDPRAIWEATLVAHAFARRSARTGPRVVWFELPDGSGMSLVDRHDAAAPLSADEIESFRAGAAAAAGDATIEVLDVLRPQGHAFAVAVRV